MSKKIVSSLTGFLIGAGVIYMAFIRDTTMLRMLDFDGIADMIDGVSKSPGEFATSSLCGNKDLLSCYDDTGEWGNVSGSIVISVDKTGKVTKVQYGQGQASAAVQACMQTKIGALTIPNFDAPAGGMVKCDYAGTYMKGNYSMHNTSGFGGFGSEEAEKK